MQFRSALWDLENRLSEWGAAYPRWRRLRRRTLGEPKHRVYVGLFFGTEEPEGVSARPTRNGGDRPWYIAACGCGWESRHSERDAAFRAAAEHSPYVRPNLLSEVEAS